MEFNGDIRKTKDYLKLPFLYNHWYVAGFTEEFGREPTGKTLLERSIVFYRTEVGELTALQNRCLHRSFPLSESSLEGDDIVCGYHGIRYNPEGEIVNIPSQSMCPNRKLRKYPVQEIGSLVFIWMGDQEADMSKLPDLPFLTDPDYVTIKDGYELKGNYLFMMENLNDLTHFAYLHRNSFGFDDSFFEFESELFETDEGVYGRFFDKRPEQAMALLPQDIQERLKGKQIKREDGGITISPGVHKGYAPITVAEEGSEDYEVFNQHILHYLTPESATTSHYFWSISLDFGDQESADLFKEIVTTGFTEDLVAVENMQNLMSTDRTDFLDMNIGSDKGSVLVRRKFVEWAKEEYRDELGAID